MWVNQYAKGGALIGQSSMNVRHPDHDSVPVNRVTLREYKINKNRPPFVEMCGHLCASYERNSLWRLRISAYANGEI